MRLARELPPENRDLRLRLYQGKIFLIAPTAATREMVERMLGLLRLEFGDSDPREIAARLPDADVFAAVGRIRQMLFLEPEFHRLVRSVLAGLGFDPLRVAFEPARLRAILPHGHENPRAAPVYYAHRDTWYAHPYSAITCWLPLDDLDAAETFVFYPRCFDWPVQNDSETFDYDGWRRHGSRLRIGWQDRNAGLNHRYPRLIETADLGPQIGFDCRCAETLVFAGAHLHQTVPLRGDRARFSLDFRVVQLDDHARGLGAPNVDGRSRGSALHDYVMLS